MRTVRRAGALAAAAVFTACALPSPAHAIIGGDQVKAGDFIFAAYLRVGNSDSCGATVLDSRNVLTAAHCASLLGPVPRTDLTVYFGVRQVSGSRIDAAARRDPFLPGDVIVHENYWGPLNRFHNDIALIRLRRPLPLETIGVQAATLPEQGSGPAPGSPVTVAGWGATNPNGTMPAAVLRSVTVPVIERTACKPPDRLGVDDGQFCAGEAGVAKATCAGDGGGPAVNADGVLVGIPSYGAVPCGPADVYTRVGNYIDWINAHRSP
ncbi:S1 family serine peptidase [Streptomyces albireticuli]|nr:serine protease [Streptomyces albireticuli]MCD9195192.1 serine protease [Streptomyces albireticuli]